MKNLAKMILEKLKKNAKKKLSQLLQVPKYLLHLSKNVLVTWAIMIPLATAVEYIMQNWFGINMISPFIQESPLKDLPIEQAAATMLLVGIWEETFFRYLIMDCMLVKWLDNAKWVAITLSSVLFGYAHVANLGYPYSMPQAVAAGAAGIWFARVYYKEGLHMALFTHGLYNFSVIMVSQYYPFK